MPGSRSHGVQRGAGAKSRKASGPEGRPWRVQVPGHPSDRRIKARGAEKGLGLRWSAWSSGRPRGRENIRGRLPFFLYCSSNLHAAARRFCS